MGEIIAKAQITEGGPVILYQPENEYSQAVPSDTDFPDQVSLLFSFFSAYLQEQSLLRVHRRLRSWALAE